MDETEIDIRSIIELLRRRIKLIATTFMTIVVGAAIYAFSLTPTFTSSALIFVDTSARDILDPSSQIGSYSDNARIDSEVEILKSDNILIRVIEQQKLINNDEFGVKLGWRDNLKSTLRIQDAELPTGDEALQSVLGKLRDAVSIKRKGLTYLISVSATSISPNMAATTANAVSHAYIEAQVQSKIENIIAARNILQSRMSAASRSIILAEQSFDVFIAGNIDTITRETGRTDIAQMRQELERIASTQANFASSAKLISQNISLKNWVEVANSLQDEAITELQKQREALANNLTAIASDSQQAIDLRIELANIDGNLLTSANSGLSALRQNISSDQAKLSTLRQQIRTSVINSNLPADILAQIYEIQQNAEIARTQYQALLTRVSELEAQAQTQIADSRIVSHALPPSAPSFPNKKLILILAGLSGLGLGIGLALLYENFVGGFSSEGQIENVVKLPVVAVVPHTDLPKKNGDDQTHLSAAELMLSTPLSAFSEAVRRLKASIDYSLRQTKTNDKNDQSKGKVIMISSAVPGEGKSTLALALGRAYAQAGNRVLLIDCDLRKPSLHRYLGVDRDLGLADYLKNPDDANILSKVIVRDKESSLTAIVGSKRSKTPTDQLSSGKALAKLISTAKSQSDYVILDSPPIIPVVDGLYLAEYADVIAMIVRFATTSQGEAKEAVSSLKRVKNPDADILMVLNQEESTRHGYRYKYSGYYGNY
ncbi:MAG: Wzz/FepE/Etk N-terminal domain-containing protein [Devosiaceae bacterium]|nr:Wzz/FepE/Etk N-terminal domain-containing protein [Devosiaceae bacterium]